MEIPLVKEIEKSDQVGLAPEAIFIIWFVVAGCEFLFYWNSKIVKTVEERIFVQKNILVYARVAKIASFF